MAPFATAPGQTCQRRLGVYAASLCSLEGCQRQRQDPPGTDPGIHNHVELLHQVLNRGGRASLGACRCEKFEKPLWPPPAAIWTGQVSGVPFGSGGSPESSSVGSPSSGRASTRAQAGGLGCSHLLHTIRGDATAAHPWPV